MNGKFAVGMIVGMICTGITFFVGVGAGAIIQSSLEHDSFEAYKEKANGRGM